MKGWEVRHRHPRIELLAIRNCRHFLRIGDRDPLT
jgi:hypothetical protein